MKSSEDKKAWIYRDGRFYFTSRAERKVLFILTIAMLICGLMVKI